MQAVEPDVDYGGGALAWWWTRENGWLPLQVNQLSAEVDGPLSLLRHGGTFAVSANGSTAAYFQSALDPVALALAPR